MIRVTILDHDGKAISPQDLTTAADLRDAVEQARNVIRACETVAREKNPPASQHGQRPTGVPYLT